ncbi:uncharacterized protein N7459_006238 [Penicillium hispanicum]|uniref:uncharacterized protein n=1 Tax=Penicillium hispanicum TaxID=1080232 RepID=UPI00253FC653|nr:uncharacterized protein N7459_006238 [Penicillium hispanicum]KAJ5580253.1 hypothetical protein N7459_006238 [Penicillium hispanicum]
MSEEANRIDFLQGLEGTKITLDSSADPPFHFPRQTWVIVKKLGEFQQRMIQEEVTDGMGIPYAAGKFLCHPVGNSSKLAFMRIYIQIPVTGTEFLQAKIREKQAVPVREHKELTVLKTLRLQNCKVTPRLLGYQQGTQDTDGFIPGGYITHLIWDKVPGEPLSMERFWDMSRRDREHVRGRFRETYQELIQYGCKPLRSNMSNIIYDKSTDQMYVLLIVFSLGRR